MNKEMEDKVDWCSNRMAWARQAELEATARALAAARAVALATVSGGDPVVLWPSDATAAAAALWASQARAFREEARAWEKAGDEAYNAGVCSEEEDKEEEEKSLADHRKWVDVARAALEWATEAARAAKAVEDSARAATRAAATLDRLVEAIEGKVD